MAINAQTLMDEAKCYACLGVSQGQLLELALWSRIASGGGGGQSSHAYYMSFNGGWEAHNLAGPLTYYYGGDLYNSMSVDITTYTNPRIIIPRSGTITKFYLKVRITTLSGTAQTVTHRLLQNGVTNIGQIDLPYNAVTADSLQSGLSAPVVAGDYMAMSVTTPLWTGTIPAGVRFYTWVEIEY